jgi:hypothetical protein
MTVRCIVGLAPILIALTGCSGRSKTPAASTLPTPEATREYVDLKPGWFLRIVAPVTKSNGYVVGVQQQQQQPESQGSVITLKASDDLIGYETALWAVSARRGGGVSIRLESAELTTNGQATPIPAPTRAAVHVPTYARFIRIFYLTRKSDADHNMALAGVSRSDQLEDFTRAFREAPNKACASQPHERIYCEWIPVGMAVRPELPKTVDGATRRVDRF